jgi:hypothetical protein
MWSKTRQVLENRLAASLKGRVGYHCDVYRTKGCKSRKWFGNPTEMHVLSIVVDGKSWFCTNPNYYGWNPPRTPEDMIRETGFVGCEWGYDAPQFIHEFLCDLSIGEAITHKNYFIRLLAVLDARLGRRRVRMLVDNIESEPGWFRKWIRLRAGMV